jgi:sulfite exporter TauE/SafE
MTGALLLTGALMGLAGTPHCVSMCAAGCAAAARRCAPQQSARALAALLLGRLLAYAAAGAVVASMAEGARWFVDGTSWLKPIWTMLQIGLLLLGVWLLLRGRLPPTIEAWAERLGRQPPRSTVQKIHLPGELKAFGLGALWPALPCGLLHAALLVAAVASGPVEGASVMAAFGLTSSLALVIGPALWLRLLRGPAAGGVAAANPVWAMRLAGASIVIAVGWSMGHALLVELAPSWCA